MLDITSFMVDFCFLQKEENEFNNKDLTLIKVAKRYLWAFLFPVIFCFIISFFFSFPCFDCFKFSPKSNVNKCNKKKQGCLWKSFSAVDCGVEVKSSKSNLISFPVLLGFCLVQACVVVGSGGHKKKRAREKVVQTRHRSHITTKWFDSKLPSIRRWPGHHKWITKSTVHTFQILQQLDDEYKH